VCSPFCVSRFLATLVLLAFCRCLPAQTLNTYAEDFLKSTFASPETIWEPALSAGGSVAWNDFVSPIDGYGAGWVGYGHHYVVALADNVSGKFMRQFAFASAAHHEDNYSPKSENLWVRVGLAALHTIYVCPGTGDWKLTWKTLNWSGIPASFASAGFSNVYQPYPQRNWTSTLERVGTGTLGYTVGNAFATLTSPLKKNHPRLQVALRNRYVRQKGPE